MNTTRLNKHASTHMHVHAGIYLATGSGCGELRIWDVSRPTQATVVSRTRLPPRADGGGASVPDALLWHPRDNTLLVVDADGRIATWAKPVPAEHTHPAEDLGEPHILGPREDLGSRMSNYVDRQFSCPSSFCTPCIVAYVDVRHVCPLLLHTSIIAAMSIVVCVRPPLFICRWLLHTSGAAAICPSFSHTSAIVHTSIIAV